MTITAMRRVTLCGPLPAKESTLAALQRLGALHLIPLGEPTSAPPPSAQQRRAHDALRHLQATPRPRRAARRTAAFKVDAFVERVLANKEALRRSADQRDFLHQRCDHLRLWGEFRFPAAADLADYKFWFYILPSRRRHHLAAVDIPWQIVHQTNTELFVVLISRSEPPSQLLPVPRLHLGAKSLSELEAELEAVEQQLEDLQAEREALTRYRYLLLANLARAEDRAALAQAANSTLDSDGVFLLQGWVPLPRLAAVKELATQQELALLVAEPTPTEAPPTLLENPPSYGGASDLTLFYQTPGYRGWDPSLVVFSSFVIFFAMILADAGYAALLGLTLALFWRRLSSDRRRRRLRNLAAVTVAAALGYGVAVGGYFGLAPAADSLWGRWVVIDINDFDAMMRVAIVIGALHLSVANAIVAWRHRGSGVALEKLGWIIATLSGLTLWLGQDQAALTTGGGLGIALGLGLVFLGPLVERPGHTAAEWLYRSLLGVGALANVTKLFGDVLSYLRLFALGLASASLAITFNDLAGQVSQLPGVGLLLALLVLLFGHGINLALGVMSGVVHGLRLNFIELFSWSSMDEGYPFRPLARREISPQEFDSHD